MISAENFQTLRLNEKAQIVFDLGEELFVKSINNYSIKLYVLFDFYVEIIYFPEDNKIKQIEAITDDYLAEYYIAEIDISDLLKRI